MQAKMWAAILIGFVSGIVVAKIFHQHEPPTIVEVPVLERDIPFSGPSMREVHRDPQRYGRREIF